MYIINCTAENLAQNDVVVHTVISDNSKWRLFDFGATFFL